MTVRAARRNRQTVFVIVIAPFGFGARRFGPDDRGGRLQLARFATVVVGILCGYRVKD